MSSNNKSILIALLASVFIFGILLVIALLLFNTDEPDFVESVPEVVEPEETETEVNSLVESTIKDDKPVVVPHQEDEEMLTIKVVAAKSGKRISKASIVIRKGVDGDHMGETVYPTTSKSPGSNSKGEFKVSLAPGAYKIVARAPRYNSKRESVVLIQDNPKTVEIKLSRGLSITGKVLEKKTKRPIGGARVVAYWELGEPEDDIVQKLIDMTSIVEKTQEPAIETVSAPDGTYQLDGLKSIYYTVTGFADGFSPRSRSNIRPSAEGIDLYLPEGSKFFGRVMDTDGNSIEGAKVNAFPEVDSQDIFLVIASKSRPPVEQAETSSGGDFQFTTLGSGVYNFILDAEGFQQGRFSKVAVYEGKNEEQDFVLTPGLLLAGQVQGPEGNPIAGAWVRPIRSGDFRNENINIDFDDGRTKTGEDGQFQFNTLEPGKYSLLAWHDDYAAKQFRDVEVGNMNMIVVLASGGAISGSIEEAGSHKPISGARIVVTDLLDVKKEDVTDENGEFYVGGLSTSRRGKRYLSIHAEGYAKINNQGVKVEEGRVTENLFYELTATAGVTGKVVNSGGVPVVRARVMAKKRGENTAVPLTVGSGVSGEDGTYTINDVEAGEEIWLTVMSSEYLETESETFTINPGEKLQADDIVLNLGGWIMGVVVDSEGNGVSGASVSVRSEGETSFSAVKSTTTDRRGDFKVSGLIAGTVDLQVKTNHFLEEIKEGIEVREGLPTQGVQIQLRVGHKVSGIVLNSEDKPVRGARVMATEIVSGLKEHSTTSDAKGKFTFKTLLGDQPVKIAAEHSDYSPYESDVDVAIGTEDYVIRMDPLGGVKGFVEDLNGNPVNSFSLQPNAQIGGVSKRLSARTFQDQNGEFEYIGIPAGTYRISISAPGFSAVTIPDIVVTNGEIVDIGRFVLREGGIIDGFVLDGKSRPVSGARVRVQGGKSKFNASSSGKTGLGSAMTDKEGHFEFRNLKGGKVTLLVSHRNYVQTKLEDVDSNDSFTSRDLSIILSSGGEISGVVLGVNGRPRKNMNVYLTGLGELARDSSVTQRTKSDQKGKFYFNGLVEGGYRVTAHDFKETQRPYTDVNVGAGEAFDVQLVFN